MNINDYPDWLPTKDTIDLKCNPNIQSLGVRAEFNHPLLNYLKYLLSSLSAPNIQQIMIFMVLPRYCEPMNWRGWDEEEQVLDGVKFRGLKEVVILVKTDQDMDIIRQHLTDQFPSMHGRGILDISRGP